MRQAVVNGGVIAQVQDFVFGAEAQRGRPGNVGGDGVRPEAVEVEGGGGAEPGQRCQFPA